MASAVLAVALGFAILVWSADRFVEGSALTARHLGVPPLLIGMVIVGFGTSAPEMLVSAVAASRGNPGIALGNAYGSNIANIALILGVTALIRPIAVHSQVLRKELPILTAVTILAAWQVFDGRITLVDALVLLGVFAGLLAWSIRQGLRTKTDPLGSEVELASSIIAARKGEHDLALGNVLGSNLFNTLAVVGIAGTIRPMTVGPEVFSRDIPVMVVLTVSLFLIGYRPRGPGRVNRFEATALLAGYIGYTAWLASSVFT